MLCTDFMPCSHDPAFEQGKGRFHGVCMRVAHNVHAVFVANGSVPLHSYAPHGVRVGDMLVRDNYIHVLADVFSDVLGERSRLGIGRMKESKLPIALSDADDDFFVLTSLAPSLPFNFAADVGFVHLDGSGQFIFAGLEHRGTDAMAEIPSSFVAHSDRALNLASRHALFRFAEQGRSKKPLPQRQVGIMEDRSRSDAELVMA